MAPHAQVNCIHRKHNGLAAMTTVLAFQHYGTYTNPRCTGLQRWHTSKCSTIHKHNLIFAAPADSLKHDTPATDLLHCDDSLQGLVRLQIHTGTVQPQLNSPWTGELQGKQASCCAGKCRQCRAGTIYRLKSQHVPHEDKHITNQQQQMRCLPTPLGGSLKSGLNTQRQETDCQ